jgi:hypothetical protein
MAVTYLPKNKTKTVTKSKTTTSKPAVKTEVKQAVENELEKYLLKNSEKMAEIYTALETQKKQVAALTKEWEKLWKPAEELINEQCGANESYYHADENMILDVGVKGQRTEITDIKKCYNLMKNAGGVQLLVDTMKFNITDLKKYLTELELDEVTKNKQEGSRKVTITLK